MPLRAKVFDAGEGIQLGKDVFGRALTREGWMELRKVVQTGRVHLELPCCSTPALLRVSSLGLQHFYHKPQSECSYASETIEHMRAVYLIYQACLDAGWSAKTDWFEENWFANVLAEKCVSAGTGVMVSRRVALQVQWSSQTLQETLDKQDVLDAQSLQTVWLFHRPPPQVQFRRLIGIESRRQNLIGFSGLPLFYFEEARGESRRS